ncbi:MAG: hypothetical protein V1874_06630 [Spirochaetota bacterium]
MQYNINYNRILARESFWEGNAPFSDIVFSTGIRLIRNIYGIPFSHRQDEYNVRLLKSIAEKFVTKSKYSDLKLLDLNAIGSDEKRFLREGNLITENIEAGNNSFIILGENNDFSILINDEDHFIIQVMKPGLGISKAYNIADSVDDEFNKFAVYAYSEETGFVTSNPSTGGLKVTVIFHLPALYITKKITDVFEIVKLSRLNIEGLKDEGLKTFGSIFILSSSMSAGIPETSVLNEIEKFSDKIISLETEAREDYVAGHKVRLEDKIGRSYGVLKYARKIGYAESMDYLSDIRLGIILSIIKNLKLQSVNKLMINMQWSHLQRIAGKEFYDTVEGDIFRAKYLRDQFEWSTING